MASKKSDFKAEILAAHNAYRKQHHAPDLEWSDKAAAAAKTWVNKLAKEKVLKHGNHEGMGQNIANASSSGTCDLSGQQVTDMWYSEVSNYDYSKPVFAPNTGHFTQVVWKSCTHIGAAKAVAGNHCFVVANYLPPGNVKGQFKENVLKK